MSVQLMGSSSGPGGLVVKALQGGKNIPGSNPDLDR